MSNVLKYILILVLIGLLVLIRVFESELFYDPYLLFFQNDYLYMDFPRREILKLTFFTSLRYGLNSLISGSRSPILPGVSKRCFHSLGMVGPRHRFTAHGAGGCRHGRARDGSV